MTRAAATVRTTLHAAAAAAAAAASRMAGLGPRRGDRRDRGDVPGWVLITVMTAGSLS